MEDRDLKQDYFKEASDYIGECLDKNKEHNKMMNWPRIKDEEERAKYKNMFDKHMVNLNEQHLKLCTKPPITEKELKEMYDAYIRNMMEIK